MRTFQYFISIALLATGLIACSSSEPVLKPTTNSINQTFIDEEGDLQLIGTTTRQGLEQAPFGEWFQENYKAYAPKESM